MHSTLWLSILIGYVLGAVAAALVLPPAGIEALALPVGIVTLMLVTATAVAALAERSRPAAMELAEFALAPAAGGVPARPDGARFEWRPPAASPGAATRAAPSGATAWAAPQPVAASSAAAWTTAQPVVVWVGPGPEAPRPAPGDGAPPAGTAAEAPPEGAAPGEDAAALSAGEVEHALALGRIEVFARPIVTLPQRQPAGYEGVTRLRDADRGLIPPGGYAAAAAERAGLSGRIDLMQLRALARAAARAPGAGRRRPRLFWRLSPASLADPTFVAEAGRFVSGRPALARRLVLAPSGGVPDEAGWLALQGFRGLGARLAVDLPQEAGAETLDLIRRDVAFVGLGVGRFEAAAGLSRLDPELVGLIEGLRAAGVEPIVRGIASERGLVEVLDYRVGYGQGPLFGEPEPI